jgi:hypothetical protein
LTGKPRIASRRASPANLVGTVVETACRSRRRKPRAQEAAHSHDAGGASHGRLYSGGHQGRRQRRRLRHLQRRFSPSTRTCSSSWVGSVHSIPTPTRPMRTRTSASRRSTRPKDDNPRAPRSSRTRRVTSAATRSRPRSPTSRRPSTSWRRYLLFGWCLPRKHHAREEGHWLGLRRGMESERYSGSDEWC